MILIDYELAMNTTDDDTFLVYYKPELRDDIMRWCDFHGVVIKMDEYQGYLQTSMDMFFMIVSNFPKDLHVLFQLTFKS